ncbi:exo-beta-N-acetylmuramidase NamZ domain-containing protein [Singulisphaera sp. Ch08]|uniref:Exo-beta-N-acetylmuramidase NamZ domain-containing protein n=1 Tax=Singulisphaera sp. Ch08 TaxID=3120278 RepID=A0AAU7CCM7_9BACT
MKNAARLVLLVSFFACPLAARAALPEAEPSTVGLDAARLARIDVAVERAIKRKEVAGAVVLVGRRGKVAYVKTYGQRSVEPTAEAMTRDTIFDMASLTKPVATATSVMRLIEEGKIKLTDSIVTYLPEFDNHDKKSVTIEHLLRHRTGFIADNSIKDYADGPEKAWERIATLKLNSPPGERFLYSDVNYLVLGRLVERVSGKTLDEFARETIFEPLGMTDSRFAPLVKGKKPNPAIDLERCAPTEKEEGNWIRGVVHDPRSRALGGVAGHAGLFSTADDIAIYAQMLLDGGKGPGNKVVLAPETVQSMIDPGSTPARQRRGLGWDIATPFSHPRGRGFGPGSFGHTGFTGTSLWIDPTTQTFVIILTSRLHPFGPKGNAGPIRSEVATLASAAILDRPKDFKTSETHLHPVDCGIDVLVKSKFAPLRGKRVGLVTNHTGKTKDGVSTIDVLANAPDVKLVTLFSPEHGIRGLVDAEVGDSKDEKTGLPVLSLYGKTRKPSKANLEGVDILVYDIQDVGTRFYTYISTLGLILEAAKENEIPIIVLDRPNPIGGVEVSGPVRDDGFETFIAHHAIPVRHGMTVGELARLFNAERKIGADLNVIACEGWRREDLYDWTGLTWTNPSPNMRSLTEAILYPGVGLLEATNLATGRGTDTPFERLGAPWIDAREFSAALNGRGLPGVRFVPNQFTPKERQYAGKECGGVQIFITSRELFDPLALGIELAVVLRELYPERWEHDGFLRFIADRATYDALLKGGDAQAIRALWDAELAKFRSIREHYLLYK